MRTPEEIANLITTQKQNILLGKKDVEALASDYSIEVLDSNGAIAYAEIKKD